MTLVNTTATNRKIADLFSANKDGKLDLRPEFQRKFVWNIRHQKEFIDTILKRLPFPEIYIADGDIDVEKMISKEIVVDGQQRLKTIFRYIQGDIPITPKDNLLPFAQLTKPEKISFLEYSVTVRQLGKLDESTIKEVFRRINLTRYPLNAYEIQNAVYDGEFISIAKAIADTEAFKRIPSFSESDFSRMQNLGFVLLVMATVENGGYFTGDKELENYVRKFNDSYPNKAIATSALKRAIKIINHLGLTKDSTWYRKSNLFTLFSEIAITDEVNLPDDLTERLRIFEQRLLSSKDSNDTNDFSLYYDNMYTGTNSRQARVTRSIIFKKYILQDKP